MTEFSDTEQDAVELLVEAIKQVRQAVAIAVGVGLRIPHHLKILTTTPMCVGVEGLWVDIETEPE